MEKYKFTCVMIGMSAMMIMMRCWWQVQRCLVGGNDKGDEDDGDDGSKRLIVNGGDGYDDADDLWSWV